ncbi:MAG: Holliday junction resolvase RuvX [Ignavibacteriae bacterium]|nr:Holliday junction resolvase RuvX [Ignavibacteriota bacterium]
MPSTKRILGIDYGSRRIGISISDPLNIIARAIKVIPNSPQVIAQIKRLVEEFDVEKIVVGMPLTLRGNKGAKAKEVEQFIRLLENEFHLDIIRYDERFTTHTAKQTLRDMGVQKKQRRNKGTLDEIAAALILQGYLDSKSKKHAQQYR